MNLLRDVGVQTCVVKHSSLTQYHAVWTDIVSTISGTAAISPFPGGPIRVGYPTE
jgi:hypothetical protein